MLPYKRVRIARPDIVRFTNRWAGLSGLRDVQHIIIDFDRDGNIQELHHRGNMRRVNPFALNSLIEQAFQGMLGKPIPHSMTMPLRLVK